MIHGPLDRTAPLPEGHRETSADYGYGCLVCGVALPVGRRGPMPVYCRRGAKRLQNLRSRADPAAVPTADPRSPVLAQQARGVPGHSADAGCSGRSACADAPGHAAQTGPRNRNRRRTLPWLFIMHSGKQVIAGQSPAPSAVLAASPPGEHEAAEGAQHARHRLRWPGLSVLGLARLLGAVAGDVPFQDFRVMHHPIHRRGSRHAVREDALPLRQTGPPNPGRETGRRHHNDKGDETAEIVNGECLAEFGTGRQAGRRSPRNRQKTERKERMMMKKSTGYKGNPLDGGAMGGAF